MERLKDFIRDIFIGIIIEWIISAGGIAVIIFAFLEHLPIYQLLLIVLVVACLVIFFVNQINSWKEKSKKKFSKLTDKEVEDIIRGWVEDPYHSIRKTDNKECLFYYIVTDVNGEGGIGVARPRAKPAQIEIACSVSLRPEQKTKYDKLNSEAKAKIVNNLRIEMARYGIQYKNLSTDLDNVLLGDLVFLDDSLTEYYFKNRMHFVLSGLVLYSEVITQDLILPIGQGSRK